MALASTYRHRRAAASAALLLVVAACAEDLRLTTEPAPSPSVVAGASRTTRCLPEGTLAGEWLVRFDGYGCAGIEHAPAGPLLSLAPRAAARELDTHAQLMVGPASTSRLSYDVNVLTTRQLRTGSRPNPWEVAWVVWHYTDDEHFYYFIPKPNGWELGKRDPAYPGGQRFLASSGAQRFPVGQWHDVRVTQAGRTMTVTVNGERLVSFTDDDQPYMSGRVGLYTEDASVRARRLRVG